MIHTRLGTSEGLGDEGYYPEDTAPHLVKRRHLFEHLQSKNLSIVMMYQRWLHLKCQVGLLQIAHYWANAGDLLHRGGGGDSFRNNGDEYREITVTKCQDFMDFNVFSTLKSI